MARSATRAIRGFTLVEILVVIAILGILAAVVYGQLGAAREHALYSRAQMEFRQFATALEQYMINEQAYPADESRGIPAGVEQYISGGEWPEAPWPESVYDWDHWTVDGEPVVQISIRFCPMGGPLDACNFPDQEWADDFLVNSAVFYCFAGECRSHESESRDYPGYCVNCACREMAECHSGG